jgi:hypothetical protein
VTLDLEPGPAEKSRRKFNWSKANIEEMKSDLSTVNWIEILTEESVEAAWNIFKDKLNETVERNVAKIGSRTRLKNPWMTREILRLVRKKRRKWRAVKSSTNVEEMQEYQALEKETCKKDKERQAET